ncbi:MAG: metallophosphoesterase family protein [Terriglobales bacterium]
MKKPSLFSALLLGLLCAAGQVACHKTVRMAQTNQAPAPPPDKPDIVMTPAQSAFKFVAYGDIRFTEPGPITVREISDPVARDAIVQSIAEAKPAFVLISGDLVWRGANPSDWKRWDAETQPLRDAKIPVFPVVGNHEYQNSRFVGSGRAAGLANFLARFPDIPQRVITPWYSMQYANCYFLMLDSEDNDGPDSDQMKWVRSQLDSLPPSIDYVFLVLHRPPHTSARDAGHRERLPEIALGKMLEARLQRASRPRFVVFAGHVHNYERYERNGVVYIVSGGGGAHPHPLARDADDLYRPKEPGELEYHYCWFSIDHDKLSFEMRRLSDKRAAKFEVRDKFQLVVPAK